MYFMSLLLPRPLIYMCIMLSEYKKACAWKNKFSRCQRHFI